MAFAYYRGGAGRLLRQWSVENVTPSSYELSIILQRNYKEHRKKEKINNAQMNIQEALPRHQPPSRPSDLNYQGSAMRNMSKRDIRRFIAKLEPPITPLLINEPINAVTMSESDEIVDNDEQ